MTSSAGRPGTRAARVATASKATFARNEAEGPSSPSAFSSVTSVRYTTVTTRPLDSLVFVTNESTVSWFLQKSLEELRAATQEVQ